MTSTLIRTTDHVRGSEWQERAFCRTQDPEDYFTDATEAEVSLNCFKFCPVRELCLAAALARNERYGVWGGLNELERRQVLTTRVRVKCPHCSETRIFEGDRSAVCLACGLSWPT